MLYYLKKAIICSLGIILMILIGVVQAFGTIITAISAVVLKSISVLMIFVTIILLVFGLFTWTKTLVVFLICTSMFWIPEGLGLIVCVLTIVQGKVMDMMVL